MNITHSLEDVTSWFFETLEKLLQEKETVTVGLAGGKSFDAFYEAFIEVCRLKFVDSDLIHRIRWCVTDERVNCDPSERNDVHIWEVFLSKLCEKGWSKEEYFLRPPQNPPISFPTSSPPGQGGNDSNLSAFYFLPFTGIDIAFFGMGPDGHTASLFPHHPALQSEDVGFIKIDNAPKLPPERISLSPKSIQSLEHVCLGVVGSEKKEALANFLDETMSTEDCPAKLLRPEVLYTQV